MADLQSPKDRITLRNGYGIPCLGFGTWKMPDGEVGIDAVHQALHDGYRHIDTAAAYDNEGTVGKALASGGISREDLFITTKVWNTDRGYDATLKAFEESRAKLHLDYVDLYLIHWPAAQGAEAEWQRTNQETWRALETLYLDGLVRAIGVSNFKPHHLEPLMDAADILPMVDQIELHPGCNQEVTREFCNRHDIVVEAWSPLGSGRVLENQLLIDIAASYGCTVAQLCLRWCLQRRAIPLPKSTDPARIAENARIFWFDITDETCSVSTSWILSAKAVSIPTPSTSKPARKARESGLSFLRSLRRSMRKHLADRLATHRQGRSGLPAPFRALPYRVSGTSRRLRAGHPSGLAKGAAAWWIRLTAARSAPRPTRAPAGSRAGRSLRACSACRT